MSVDRIESIPARLAQHARLRGRCVAFRSFGPKGIAREITWSELWTAATRGAGVLSKLGLAGCNLGILCTDPLDFVVSLAAAFLCGVTAVPMPAVLSRRSASRIQAILQAADLSAIVARGDLLHE